MVTTAHRNGNEASRANTPTTVYTPVRAPARRPLVPATSAHLRPARQAQDQRGEACQHREHEHRHGRALTEAAAVDPLVERPARQNLSGVLRAATGEHVDD